MERGSDGEADSPATKLDEEATLLFPAAEEEVPDLRVIGRHIFTQKKARDFKTSEVSLVNPWS